MKTQHTQPGKGGAYLQVEMKELKEGTKMNERFRSSESVQRAILNEKEYEFLYKNDDQYVFMDNTSFEQIEVGIDIISQEQVRYLIENDIITINLYENQPVSIELPFNVTLKVIETESVVKRQTATSSNKPAVLERNIKTSVPPFIEVGDKIVINTTDSSYVEKAKK